VPGNGPRKLAVIGLGLIGGSVLRVAAAMRPGRGSVREIAGWDPSPEATAAARRAGYGRFLAPSLAEACRDADLVVVATPVRTIPGVVQDAAKHASPGVVVTDTGSTKAWILEEVARLAPGVTFVGGHPIAGADRSGFAASSAGLFTGAPWLIVPPAMVGGGPAAAASGAAAPGGDLPGTSDPSAPVNLVESFVRTLGARPITVSADEHDHWLAVTSHLPYLLATGLATLAMRRAGATGAAGVEPFTAGGFRDSTRLVLQGPEMGVHILSTNLEHIRPALKELVEEVRGLMARLETGPSRPVPCVTDLAEARDFRTELGRLKRWER
jgi:prephenate dehydrogenase